MTLAHCAELRADTTGARRLYETAHMLGTRSGEPGLTASALEGLARTWGSEDSEQAAAMNAEAAGVRERLGRPRPHYQDGWQPSEDPAPSTKARTARSAQAPQPTS